MPNVLASLIMLALAAMAALSPVAADPRAAGSATPNDTARFLAGLPPAAGSPLQVVASEPLWQSYARNFDKEWATLEQRQLSKARAFGVQNLGKSRETLYYMFSGPDFLYADAFFPTAKTYILAGLEPVGRLPDVVGLKRNQIGPALEHLRASLSDVLSRSYFITSHMDQKLRRGQLAGVMPVLYVFLARTGRTITDVTFLTLTPDGKVEPFAETTPPTTPKAVKIDFTGKDGQAQTLYFFSTNLGNKPFGREKPIGETGFLKFAETFGTGDAFIKSASYLPHGGNFSEVRDFIMRQSARILQDDTGVPIRMFKEGEWTLKPFGVYVTPIPPFQHAFQPAAVALWAKHKPTRLEFSYGYRFRNNQSNVLIATKVAR